MRRNYLGDAARFAAVLERHEKNHGPLLGIVDDVRREALIEQLIDSEQRVQYVRRLLARELDPLAADPRDPSFHPLKASIIHLRAGWLDEAVWMVFLFVHFGKHLRAGWRYPRDVYGALGSSPDEWWTWERTSLDPIAFRYWLDEHQAELVAAPGPRGFGNHRKYESLNAWESTGTGEAFESYVAWVLDHGDDHGALIRSAEGDTQSARFDSLYESMRAVHRFGRIARFDYLTMLMKLGIADIAPPHSYLKGATGPLRGARLLVNGDAEVGTAVELQNQLAMLSAETGISPDVVEDAVCNWQKSPERHVRFSG